MGSMVAAAARNNRDRAGDPSREKDRAQRHHRAIPKYPEEFPDPLSVPVATAWLRADLGRGWSVTDPYTLTVKDPDGGEEDGTSGVLVPAD